MKRFNFITALLAVLLIFGLTFAGCSNDTIINIYEVTFSLNGGSGTVPDTQNVNGGSSITLPSGSGLSKNGFTFGGWNTNASGTGTNYKAESPFTPAASITLYAKWDTNTTGTPPVNNKRLSSIPLVEQPADSQLCGVANIKMIEEWYFGRSNGWDYIFDQVSTVSSQGRRNNAGYKMANYIERRNLFSSYVRFSDLLSVLYYLEQNQFPAIMFIQTVNNPLLGHIVLFAGYNSATGYVTIRDPENSNRTSIHYDDLVNLFKKVSFTSEVGGNDMIIVSDRMISGREYSCWNCGKTGVIDEAILNAIAFFICNNCDRLCYPYR